MVKYQIRKDDILEIYTDGASRRNPGPSAYAYIFKLSGEDIPFIKKSKFIGKSTNNVAEYKAILHALEEAMVINAQNIVLYSDSQLAVNQLTKKWKINKKHLQELVERIWEITKQFNSVRFIHVRRTNKYIRISDRLCNESLDNNL